MLPVLRGLGSATPCRPAETIRDPASRTHRDRAGFHGAAREVSNGKDTPSGHWEIAGVPVPFDWGYFPHTVPTFRPT